MLAEPRAAAVQVSQRLAGHVVDAIETQGDWVRVRGADGYEGWTHSGYLTRVPGTDARQSRGSRRISLGCHTRTPGGGRRTLPLGAVLGPEESVESGEVVNEAETEARFPRTAAAIARSAQEFFDGASYQWGGITPWGADCSGFVQTVFWLHGVNLPRDAWQQAEAGAAGSPTLSALQQGELAFFSDRDDLKVTHVGLGIGGGRMAHVAIGRGGFAIERLSDGHDGYVRKLRDRFRFVRQVL
jgi:cell wall-associated NlpC family hydrolase